VHRLANALQELYEIPQVGDIRQCGLIVGIEIVRDPTSKESFDLDRRIGERIVGEARKRGTLLRARGDVMLLVPAPGISVTDLQELVRILQESIRSVIGSEK